MGIEIIMKIAGIGVLCAVANIILKKSDKGEIGVFVTIAGIVISLIMVADMVGGLFDTIKQIFGLN